MRGVIDSTDIPLNVSRSALQTDHCSENCRLYFPESAIASKNSTVAAKNTLVFGNVGTFVKFGSQRRKFKKQVEDIIIYRTTYEAGRKMPRDSSCSGAIPGGRRLARCNPIPKPYSDSPRSTSQYTTLKEYLERNKDHNENRVFYCTDAVTQATM